MPEKAMQLGGVLKSANSKNVTNGLKASEKVKKVAEVKGSTVEYCRMV